MNAPTIPKIPRVVRYANRHWNYFGLKSSDGRMLLGSRTNAAEGCRAPAGEVEEIEEEPEPDTEPEPDSQNP